MKLRDIPKIVLSDSPTPLSAREIWKEAVRRGLDKAIESTGKTPDASIGAYLYTNAKGGHSLFVAVGAKPTRFRLAEMQSNHTMLPFPSDVASPSPKSTASSWTSQTCSKYLAPCIEALKKNAPKALGVGEIVKAVMAAHPDLQWARSNGAIRAALLRAAKIGSNVRTIPESRPPKFFFSSVAEVAPSSILPPEQPISRRISIGTDSPQLSFLGSAEKVLREFGAKNPMHYRDITERAINLGWLISDGATPEATMAAQIGTDIKKRADVGKKPLFVKCGRGYFGLAEWIDPIQADIDRHNSKVRADLLAKLREMPPDEFEKLIGRLLDAMDFLDTEVTKKSGDGGIDVRGTWTVAEGIAIKMAIQVKRWKKGHNVQAPVVQAVRGALKGSERGMIITTSDFSKGAREDAENLATASTISLVNGEQLVKLLVQYAIGVKQHSVNILELDTDFTKTE